MNIELDYILWTHTESSVKTLTEFCDGTNLVSIIRGWNVLQLLRYEDKDGKLNIKRVFEKYSLENKNKYSQIYLLTLDYLQSSNLDDFNKNESLLPLPLLDFDLLETNTILALPRNQLNRDVLIGEGNQINIEEYETFLSDKLKELLSHKDYTQTQVFNKSTLGISQSEYPDISVWLWCRAISKSTSFTEPQDLEGTLLNITPFITNLNTSVSKGGGSWSLSLAPIIGKWDYFNGSWMIKEESYNQYIKDNQNNFIFNGTINKIKGGELLENDFLFHNIIGENDIIFIRFESLKLEENVRLKDNKLGFEISPDNLPNRIYDMIGLVDTNVKSLQSQNSDVVINIGGRDLTKLLIEDGCYFYPADFLPNGMFANNNNEHFVERADGKIYSLTQGGEKTIEYSLKFVINALSNMGICPNSVFDAYGHIKSSPIIGGQNLTLKSSDERSYRFDLDIENRKKIDIEEQQIQNLVRRAKQSIKQSIIDSKLEDTSIINEIFDTLGNLLDSLKKSNLIDANNDFIVKGWNQINFGSEDLAKNALPHSLDNKFFQRRSGWVNSNNKIITNAQALDVIKRVKAMRKELRLAEEDAGVDKSMIEQELTSADKGVITQTYSVKDNPYFKDIERKIAKGNKPDATTINPSIYSQGAQDLIREKNKQQLKDWDKLKEDINKLGNSIFYVTIFTFLDDLNCDGKDAINLIWELKNRRDNITKDVFVPALMSGIWQIIKISLDDEIRSRRLVDSSIGNESGSILNHINKICQEPFIEFSTDTYKDQFHLIARKPPFTKNKIVEYINSGLVIDIEPEDILSTNLKWTDGQSYSWYKITPQSILGGAGNEITLAYLKAVHFFEYAYIYGNKPLDIITNYIPHFPMTAEGKSIPISEAVKQVILDLKYLIEICSYLPFTREGSITLNGDRRIKRGTWVRLKTTKELFYVDLVSNSANISMSSTDRSTSINVNRGMVEKYIQDDWFNYFNIIDTFINPAIFENNAAGEVSNLLQNWKVNKEVFNFFQKRQQLNN